METLSRDSTSEKPVAAPVDRRLPLKMVQFVHPAPIPGFQSPQTLIIAGGTRLDGGLAKVMPQPFLDPVLHCITIGDTDYPLERVVLWKRAKLAMTRMPDPVEPPNYTIGRIPVPKEPSVPPTQASSE